MCERFKRARDEGMTLPEVLIGMMLIGVIMAGISSAIIVTLRQNDNTTGRLNNARSEQGVGIWMPADLASANQVTTDPAASPCGTSCPPGANVGGSNALMLSWTSVEASGGSTVTRTTNVSYRYVLVGDEYQLIRVECSTTGGGWECQVNVVLHNLDGPPAGVDFVPGVTEPYWVMQVSEPLDPASTGETGGTIPADPGLKTKNAKRVVVTINGGGDAPGQGGGTNQISLSAGGTDRQDLDKTSLVGVPSFNAARSRCGGNITLIVDESNSIGTTAMNQVRSAIAGFVSTFAGTPVKLQIVRFATTSSVLGASGWSRYFNMLDETDVSQLSSLVTTLNMNGGTNWEDAWFRTFFNSDGTVQTIVPDLVVFFTDGVPTYSRLNQTSASAPTTPPNLQGFPLANGSSYNQEAFYRANYIAQQFRSSVRLIGVGVGPDINANNDWLSAPIVYERGYHWEYERRGVWYEASNKLLWQRNASNTYQRKSNLIYEQRVSGSWTSRTKAQFDAGNTTPDESDGWRARTASGGSWEAVSSNATTSRNVYDAANSIAGESDGWRTVASTSGSWTSVSATKALYELSNTTSGESDGWRTAVSSTSNVTWTEVTQQEYNLSNTTSNSNDGWRTLGSTNGWTETSAADYDAHPGDSNYRKTAEYSSPYSEWEVVSKSVYDSISSSSAKRSNASSVTQSNTKSSTILARIISGNDIATPAVPGYGNAAQANLYITPNWSEFGGALKAVALAECGGTLTLQTRMGGSPAPDPFKYQNTAITTTGGAPLPTDLSVVTTTRQFVSGTFDFDSDDGLPRIIEIQPQNISDLVGYSPVGWSCKAGLESRSFTTFPIPNTVWTGIRVQVAPNEAVSCVQTVTR